MDRALCVTGKLVLNRLIKWLSEVLTNEIVITAVPRPYAKMSRSRQAELMHLPHDLQIGNAWPHRELTSDRFPKLARPLVCRSKMHRGRK